MPFNPHSLPFTHVFVVNMPVVLLHLIPWNLLFYMFFSNFAKKYLLCINTRCFSR